MGQPIDEMIARGLRVDLFAQTGPSTSGGSDTPLETQSMI